MPVTTVAVVPAAAVSAPLPTVAPAANAAASAPATPPSRAPTELDRAPTRSTAVPRLTTAQSLANLLATPQGTKRSAGVLHAMEELRKLDREQSVLVLPALDIEDDGDQPLSVVVPPKARQVLPWVLAALTLQFLLLWASGLVVRHCTSNPELAHCDNVCEPRDELALFAAFELVLYVPYRCVLAISALRMVGVFAPRYGLALGAATGALSLGSDLLLNAHTSLEPEAVYVVNKVLFELGMLALINWHVRRSAFRGRVRPLVLYVTMIVVLTALLVTLTRALADVSPAMRDVALTSVPLQLVGAEFALIATLRRTCQGYSAADISVVCRMMVAGFEGLRIGMLLVASDSLGTFAASLALSSVVEVLSRNDLWWTSFRKVACGWSDEQVHARFSQVKELALAARFDAEYAPILVTLLAPAVGYTANHIMIACDGDLLDFYVADAPTLAAIVGAEIVTDIVAVRVSVYMRRHRPLLARDLALEMPASRLMAFLLPMACVFQAVLALGGVSLMYDVSGAG